MEIFNELRDLLNRTKAEVNLLNETLTRVTHEEQINGGSLKRGNGSCKESDVILITKLEEAQNLKICCADMLTLWLFLMLDALLDASSNLMSFLQSGSRTLESFCNTDDSVSLFKKSIPEESSLDKFLQKFSDLLDRSESAATSVEKQLDDELAELKKGLNLADAADPEMEEKPTQPSCDLYTSKKPESSVSSGTSNSIIPSMADFGIDPERIAKQLMKARENIPDLFLENSENKPVIGVSSVLAAGDGLGGQPLSRSDDLFKNLNNALPLNSKEAHCVNQLTAMTPLKPELHSSYAQTLQGIRATLPPNPPSPPPPSAAPLKIESASTSLPVFTQAMPAAPVLSEYSANILRNINFK